MRFAETRSSEERIALIVKRREVETVSLQEQNAAVRRAYLQHVGRYRLSHTLPVILLPVLGMPSILRKNSQRRNIS
jgi:hypothetical protein